MELYLSTAINIYLCQLNFHVGNLNSNFDKIISAREKIKREGGDLCIFSELSITGYPRLYDNKLMNSAAIIHNGKISIIDKFHLPNYGVFDEKRVFNSNRMPGPIVFKDIRIGLM